MKIETSIKPRKDGTVSLAAPSGVKIVFADEAGHLVAEVADEGDLAFVLALGDFFPADETDYVQAASVVREKAGIDDLPDDEGDLNAAPVEVVATPRAPRAKKKK